ncbi:MAG: DoxX family protein [Actinomycetota bacterium]
MDELSAVEFDIVMTGFRVIFGLIFAAHGYAKFFQGGRISGTAGWFDSMGMKPGRFHALLAASTEMGSGIAIALGLFTPLAAAAVIAVMVVAGWTVHRSNGFFIVREGWEYTFVVGLIAAAIAGLGPGRVSLDALLGLDESLVGIPGLLIAVGVGLVAGIAQIAIFYRPPAPSAD